jgi:hypothetical protein
VRLRSFFAILLLVAATIVLVANLCLAHGTPENVAYFRLLPDKSALHQTDGAAAIDYELFGEVIVRYGGIWSTNAFFEIADVWGSLPSSPPPAMAIDVDETLYMEGLNGAVLPSPAPTEVYRFQGYTFDGSALDLYVAMTGPWLYLRGSSQLLPGSTEDVTYNIRALGRPRPFADLSDNGLIDAADYVLLRNSSNAAAGGGATYDDWKEQFGERLLDVDAMDAIINAAIASSLSPAAAATANLTVPEPTTVALATLTALLLASRRRR